MMHLETFLVEKAIVTIEKKTQMRIDGLFETFVEHKGVFQGTENFLKQAVQMRGRNQKNQRKKVKDDKSKTIQEKFNDNSKWFQ